MIRARTTNCVRGLCLLLVSLLAIAGCEPEEQPARIAVTNSYLEAAAREFISEREPILRLAEPGMCPGHFDMRPSQARALSRCEVLLRFDFQHSFDEKLSFAKELRIAPVTIEAGLASIAGYLQACEAVASALDVAPQQLESVRLRMELLHDDTAAMMREAGLEGASVIVSRHQAYAARQLGLRVIAEFAAADQSTLRQIDAVIQAGRASEVRCVIANRPEGTELAASIAARLGVPLVVFHNFPEVVEGGEGFDRMHLGNADRLIDAIGS